MRQQNMAMSSAGLQPKNDCSGKAQKQLYKQIIDSSSRQKRRYKIKKPQLSKGKQGERKIGHGS
jgi:hypothetical protein